MISFPNAKINIGLSITDKRPDGFHNIESCFYPVDWCDILEIIPSDKLEFTSSGIPIPGNPNTNLCIAAYNLLKSDYNIPPVKIHLHKIIPIGAGLGGGSSDAAFTIKSLNKIFELQLTNESLIDYARQLGSDCAFFINNEPVIAVEKGDVFEKCNLSLKSFSVLLVYPNIHISTAEAYQKISPKPSLTDYKTIDYQNIEQWSYINDFEQPLRVKYPELAAINKQLIENGAIYTSLSGSGSTMYGIFRNNIMLDFPKDYLIKNVELR